MPDELTKIKIHQSLTRPILVCGAERNNVIILGCVSACTFAVGKDAFSLVGSIIIWAIGIRLLRQAAKHDSQMTAVYQQYMKYLSKDHYSATETINAPVPPVKKFKM